MPQIFKCPSCGGPLEYDGGEKLTVQCPFCSHTVIVPEELRPANAAPRPDPSPVTPLVLTTRHEIKEKLKEERHEARGRRRELRHQLRKSHHGDE